MKHNNSDGSKILCMLHPFHPAPFLEVAIHFVKETCSCGTRRIFGRNDLVRSDPTPYTCWTQKETTFGDHCFCSLFQGTLRSIRHMSQQVHEKSMNSWAQESLWWPNETYGCEAQF